MVGSTRRLRRVKSARHIRCPPKHWQTTAGGLRSGTQNNGKHTVLFPEKAGSKGHPARGLTVLPGKR